MHNFSNLSPRLLELMSLFDLLIDISSIEVSVEYVGVIGNVKKTGF